MERLGDFNRRVSGDLSVDDARRLQEEAPGLVDAAEGQSWYEEYGNPIDLATARLCLLRRAKSGVDGSMQAGDEAVREALGRAKPEAVVWLASRVVSYMDEQGYPDLVPGAQLD
jgi:hypothetical protein